ncbi:hypothetical protein HWV62_42215 [Athelia sp. TMB]|nr:hypothetical protein HWV62_42215 [Athelia sp. TMB]
MPKKAIDLACQYFPSLDRPRVTIQTKDLAVCDGHLAEITQDSWLEVIGDLKTVEVIEADAQPQKKSLVLSTPFAGQTHLPTSDYKGRQIPVTAQTSTLLEEVLDAVTRRLGICRKGLRATHDYYGTMNPDRNLAHHELENGDTICLHVEQIGGKPVIYLHSPNEIAASVKLSLVPEWEFSVIYPKVPIKEQRGQHIEWTIRTQKDGSLVETSTGTEVAYLFWEAETDSTVPMTPPLSPVSGQLPPAEYFSPAHSDLHDDNAVVLGVDSVPRYLEKALAALGLHLEARTSFITYWLPSILKHSFVALRFVPQESYERAAPLEVTPRPDVITRVFMLFKGLSEDVLNEWTGARARADEDVVKWQGIVGVDASRMADTGLFRVLEWGGMEVLGSQRVLGEL